MAGDESHTNIDELQIARADAVELQRGVVLAGRYEIEALLGRGGAGLVLRAFDRELREAVAIKVLRPDLGNAARWIERLAREVKLARQLRHPNVCRVFDFEKADGHVFIVMELAGGTLRRELDDGALARRPVEARLADARAVAAGLAAIHEAGIAHRDVTPQNVLRMPDGRLVVSDFGLATEVSQTTTSIHGGTVAYMAPEVVRGQRGTVASDVWALGVVIHEIVFGERPTWSKPVGGAPVAPAGRTLSRAERDAFAVCRACTAEVPGQRPRSAREVEAWLGGKRMGRAPSVATRVVAVGLALAAVAGLVATARRSRRGEAGAARTVASERLITFTGEAADWSRTSRLLATIDDRIRCLATLPDGHTLRFVWGSPAHAEDLDTVTGKRRPSPLVPAAYAEGCPDLSSDGQRLVFQGYTEDGRPYAFLSAHPDGRDARPVVGTADTSISSEPRWLGDGTAFAIDVDNHHTGVFSTATNRLTVLPEPTRDYLTSFRFGWRDVVYVAALLGRGAETEIVGTAWPSLEERARFRMPGSVVDVATADGKSFLVTARSATTTSVLQVDPKTGEARRLGAAPRDLFRYLTFAGSDLAFAWIHLGYDAWLRHADGTRSRLTSDGVTADAVPCGKDVLVSKWWQGESASLWRLDATGTVVRKLPTAALANNPACSPDGRAWFYVSFGGDSAVYRCDEQDACRRILDGGALALAVSPNGRRLAVLDEIRGVDRVRWMPSEGGPLHDVGDSDGLCAPGWSSDRTLWIARRRGRGTVWTEMDVERGAPTGKVAEGSGVCLYATRDPRSPVASNVSIIPESHTEIRLQLDVAPPR
jgi:hypothetical protein